MRPDPCTISTVNCVNSVSFVCSFCTVQCMCALEPTLGHFMHLDLFDLLSCKFISAIGI